MFLQRFKNMRVLQTNFMQSCQKPTLLSKLSGNFISCEEEVRYRCSRKMIHIFLAHLPTASLLHKIQDAVSPTDICASQSRTHFISVHR